MNKKTLFIFLLVLFVAFLFGSSAYLQEALSGLTAIFDEFVQQHPVFGPAAFFLLTAVSILLGPFSSLPIIPLAIAAWKVVPTLSLLLLGWLAGGCGAYAVGRYAGQPLVGKIVGRQRLEEWMAKLRPRMTFPLLLLFRLAMPSETGYVFGLLGYDFGRYLLITFLAELPFALLAVYAGDAFLRTGWWSFAALLLAGVAIIALTYYLFIRRFKKGT